MTGGVALRGLAAAVVFVAMTAEAQAEVCFSQLSNRHLRFPVIRLSVPPPAGALALSRYKHFPLTAAATQDTGRIAKSVTSRVHQYQFLWANRCQDLGAVTGRCGHNQKGNGLFPPLMSGDTEVRAYFTSVARANGCTLTQAAHSLGYSRTQVASWSQSKRFTIAATREEALALVVGGRLVDVCVLPDVPLASHAKGIMLDYEPQDARSTAQTTDFAHEFTKLVHDRRKLAILYTNPLDGPISVKNGISRVNANLLHRLFDGTTVLLWSGNHHRNIRTSFRRQIEMLSFGGPVDRSRLIATLELRYTRLADIKFVHDLMRNDELSALLLWHNGAPAGGDCDLPTNRKIACAVLGRCP